MREALLQATRSAGPFRGAVVGSKWLLKVNSKQQLLLEEFGVSRQETNCVPSEALPQSVVLIKLAGYHFPWIGASRLNDIRA